MKGQNVLKKTTDWTPYKKHYETDIVFLCFVLYRKSHISSFLSFFSSDLHDLQSGFSIIMLFVCLLYSPLCTFLAYIYKISKVNIQIIKHPLLFSLSPYNIFYYNVYVRYRYCFTGFPAADIVCY